MMILPAVDIRNGKCVRLRQGDFNRETVFYDDPVVPAKEWEKQGAQYLHLVDLDGALAGKPINDGIVKNIIEQVKIPLEIGGGIRTIEDVDRYLNLGVDRVILGTKAVTDIFFVKECTSLFDSHIAVGIDSRNGKVSVEGWVKDSDLDPISLGKVLVDVGVKTIIGTDITVDGTLKGVNIAGIEEFLNQVPVEHFIVSGGISKPNDLKSINEINSSHISGCIVGKALYSGQYTLYDFLEA